MLITVLGVIPLLSYAFLARSELRKSGAAGVNGGFETTQAGLPVNWICYTAKSTGVGDHDLVLDTTKPKEGRQSLKFIVRQCSPKGGRFSPGVSQEFKAIPGETYTVSFWARNEGAEFVARAGAVNAFNGRYKTVVKTNESFTTWRQFTGTVSVPQDMQNIRFELNILGPGVFSIDDFRIEQTK